MIEVEAVWRWWLQAALTGSIVLAAGSGAVALARAPVQRARLAVWTLLGCGLVPVIIAWPGLPRWSVAGWTAEQVVRPVEPVAVRVKPAEWRDPEPGFAAATARPEPAAVDEGGALAQSKVVAAVSGVDRSRQDYLSPRFPTDARLLVLAGWCFAGATWLGWWLLGQAMLGRVIRSSRPVDAIVRDRFREIAGPGGARVRLLRSDRIALPITFTRLRATILLPTAMAAEDAPDLVFALTHEWSHVERRDDRSWTLGSLVGTLWAWHPLFWYIRRQLRLSQDYLADDRASGVGPPEEFAACLVRLCRARRDPSRHFPLPALGIGARRSHLTRRVTMLLADRPPHDRRCRTRWTAAVATLAASIFLAAAGIRLDAAPPAEMPAQTPAAPPEPRQTVEVNSTKIFDFNDDIHGTKRPAPADLLTPATGEGEWVGRVVAQGTGAPLAGARVEVVILARFDAARNDTRLLRTIRLVTPADGSYRFAITREEAAERLPLLGVNVEHDDHVRTGHVYDYRTVLKLLDQKIRPAFERIELWPAEAIEGLVLTPEGLPAAGVEVQAYSVAAQQPVPQEAATPTTRTDNQGRFRLLVHPAGPGYLRLDSPNFEPLVQTLKPDRRPDLGTFRLARGSRIRGQVLDAAGRPLGGIKVEALGVGGTPAVEVPVDEQGLRHLASNPFVRTGLTLEDGTFALAPLPAGTYEVKPIPGGAPQPPEQRTPTRPLPAVFLTRVVRLGAAQEPAPLTIRAVPHVRVRSQVFDEDANPVGGPMIRLSGKLAGRPWSTGTLTSPGGNFLILAPRGLTEASLALERPKDSITRYGMRLVGPDQPTIEAREQWKMATQGQGDYPPILQLFGSNRFYFDKPLPLPTLVEDLFVTIGRSRSPIVLIEAVTDQGQPIAEADLMIQYTGRPVQLGSKFLSVW